MLTLRRSQIQVLSEVAVDRFVHRLSHEIARWFPERTADLGIPALRRRVRSNVEEARRLGFPTERQVARFVAITFALGEGFHRRYDWARRILADPRGMTPARKLRLL